MEEYELVSRHPELEVEEEPEQRDEESGGGGDGGGGGGGDSDDRPLLGDDRSSAADSSADPDFGCATAVAVSAVRKGAWQVSCVLGVLGVLLSGARALIVWFFVRFYLRRTYIDLPLMIWTWLDACVFLLLAVAEPYIPTDEEDRDIRIRAPEPDTPDLETDAPPHGAPRRMDAFMVDLFTRRRRKKKRKKAQRRGLGRLGCRMPIELVKMFTPSRRFACCVAAAFAVLESAVAVVLGLFAFAVRAAVTVEPDGRAVYEWTGLRLAMANAGGLAFLSPGLRVVQAFALVACAVVPQRWYRQQQDTRGVAYQRDGLKRKWRLASRTPRAMLGWAFTAWVAASVCSALLLYALVLGLFTPYHHGHSDYWLDWLPFPSERFVQPDTRTPTGYRVHFPDELAPPLRSSKRGGERLDVAALLGGDGTELTPRADGFSTVAPLLFALHDIQYARHDLIGFDQISRSLGGNLSSQGVPAPTPTPSLVTSALLELPDEQGSPAVRIAHWVEWDAWAGADMALLHPAVPLKPGSWYVAAVRGLRDQRTGALLEAGEGVTHAQRLALRQTTGGRARALRAAAAPVKLLTPRQAVQRALARLQTCGDPELEAWAWSDDLQLVWAFPTASDASRLQDLNHMRNRTQAWVHTQALQGHSTPSKVTRTESESCPAGGGVGKPRAVWGTLVAPSFVSDSSSRFAALDHHGWTEWNSHVGWVLLLPCSVLGDDGGLDAISGVVQYGHGLFADRSEAAEADWLLELAHKQRWAVVAADWRGMSRFDVPVLVRALMAEPDGLRATVGNLKQSFVHQMVLGELAPALVARELAPDNRSAVDTLRGVPRVFYGVSNGAILGAGLTSWAAAGKGPWARAVLVSGGASFAGLVLTRSVKFELIGKVLDLCFFDRRSERLLLTLLQVLWDPLEATGWASDPSARTHRPPTLVQVAAGDSQVTVLAGELLARTLGATMPAARPAVWGVPPAEVLGSEEQDAAPWPGAVFTEMAYQAEATEVPKRDVAPDETGVHECLRRDPWMQDQAVAFVAGFDTADATASFCHGPAGACTRAECPV